MSDWNELDAAVAVLRAVCPVTVIQCSSLYPCPPEQVGLNVIPEMRARWGLPVGYSDHTLGLAVPPAAAAVGATVIEKHFTFSRMMYGSDAKHSTEPAEFRVMVDALHAVWRMLEHPVDKSDAAPYRDMKRTFEKSVVTAVPVRAGTPLARESLAFKKPGDGIPARRYCDLIGRRMRRDLPADHKLAEADLE